MSDGLCQVRDPGKDASLDNFVNDDSPSGIKLKNFADSYRTAVEKWRSKISDETRRTILGYFFGSEKEQIMDHWIIIS